MNIIKYYNNKEDIYNKLLNFAKKYNKPLDWNNRHQKKYYISYDDIKEEFSIGSNHCYRELGTIYFSSLGLAYEVINKYYEELKEYFKNNRKINYKNKLLNEIAQFAEENNEYLNWNNDEQKKYYIWYDYYNKKIEITYPYYNREFGNIYFSSKKLANKIRNKYKTELIDYFEER